MVKSNNFSPSVNCSFSVSFEPFSQGSPMEPVANMDCVLKVNVHCEACKMKIVEVLHSIVGVYSVTIDAEEGTANVSGVVDREVLLQALATTGKHGEVKKMQLKHPGLNRSYYNRGNEYRHGSTNYYGYDCYGTLQEPYPYGYQTRGLPARFSHEPQPHHYPMRRAFPEYPPHATNYYQYPPARYPYPRH